MKFKFEVKLEIVPKQIAKKVYTVITVLGLYGVTLSTLVWAQ